jgi:2-dehydropantoate 2-reductase
VETDAGGVGPVDVVLVTVKATGTGAAGELAKKMLGPDTAVISLQNGVENEDRLAAIVGGEHVLGGTCYILSLIESPGKILHSIPLARLIFGEQNGITTPRAEAFRSACETSGIDTVLSDDIASAIWTKFTALCPHNGMTAVCRKPIGPIRDDPDCRGLLAAAAREVIALAEARGVTMPDDVVADPLFLFDRVPAEMTSSTLYDLEHGKPLEVDWLHGAMVRLGREAGVATPVNGFIYCALKLHVGGGG